MTLNYGIFDVSDPQNPDRVYSAALLSRMMAKHIRDGIVHGDGGELAVSASDPPAMSVQVGTGTAMIRGRFCESDAVLTLAVPAADTTYARIDRVVVRLNASPGRVIDILVKKGTPAPSPAPPGLTRTPETWELSLAQISVAAGATMVQTANITDERGNTSLCGVAAPVYVPSSQLEVVGAMNMQGHALTGLPAPSGVTDAARKGYVDEVIGGFGISQIAIDADKNWNGKSITNTHSIATSYLSVDKITFTRKMSVADINGTIFYTNSNTYSVSSGQPTFTNIPTVTVPPGLVDGSTITIAASIYSPAYRTPTLTCFINGVSTAALSYTPEYTGWGSSSTTVTIKSGEVISFALSPPLYSGGAPTTGSVKDISLRGNIVDMPMVSIANDPVWPPSI